MNFASPYVFNNAAESDTYEVVSDEEYMGGMELSDSGSDEELGMPVGSYGAEFCTSGAGDRSRTARPPPPPPLPASNSTGEVYVTPSGEEESDAAKDSSKPSMLGRVMGFFSSGHPPSLPAKCRMSSDLKSSRRSTSASKENCKEHHWKSSDSSREQVLADADKQGKRRVFRRADTNVVSLRFDTLKTPSAMHAGEVILCSDCEAIMSHVSEIKDDGPDKVWKCEFCGHRNLVEIEEEEKPTAPDVTYLMEPALSTTASGTSGRDESMVIFCIDTSGSMTITTEVPGHQKLRGSDTIRRLRREMSREGDQHMPRERRNVTYISRLQAVQAAVDHQLGEMAREFPHRRVGLVTFSYEVNVIGDSTEEEVVVSGEKLTDQDALTKVGSELPCPKAIKETRSSLGEKVFGLEEGGSTALGPALIIALSMASKHPGSKVIICTDGKSNEGVGKVENVTAADPDPDDFYEGVAKTANDKGVSISVVTIKGTDCKLIHLGKLADSTGGQVNIVDPLKLTEEFSNVLADRIIATSVVATFILHRGLYIGKEENEASKEKRVVGNVRADHEISFEYGMRKIKPKQTSKPNPLDRISEVSTSMEVDNSSQNPTAASSDAPTADKNSSTSTETQGEEATGAAACAAGASGGETGAGDGAGGDGDEDIPSELPFQLQISYTDIDGTKALRVLTQKKPVTRDRKLAEKDADLNVLGVHTERKASELALEGDYTGSRAVALMNQRLGWRSRKSCRLTEERTVMMKVTMKMTSVS
ncbi:circularly permutated Ras protein 1-like isoform X2 [Littorina saxatilis]|uniref:circularly permutated Ras protein 1-like isoform X2 n=1 Tax=Littorina saxatilis TaxID=31220 RepID=UPI0038B55162